MQFTLIRAPTGASEKYSYRRMARCRRLGPARPRRLNPDQLTAWQPYGATLAPAPTPTREPATRTIARSMRARARVALVSMTVSASFGLAGCAAIDELKDTILRWVESEKLPDGRGVFPDDLPTATPVIPPENPSKKEASKASKKKNKLARKLPRPQTVVLPPKKPPVSDSPETARPDETEGQSAPPASMRLRTPFPEAPPPGVFSR